MNVDFLAEGRKVMLFVTE